MDSGTSEPQSPLEKGLEQKHAEAGRPNHRHGPSGQERREGYVGSKSRVYRWARDPQHGLASRFFQMRSRTILLSFIGMLLVPFVVRAQASQPRKGAGQTANQVSNETSNRAPADFTGVWYPSTGSTLGAATPDNPGQQFVWLDAEGKPLKGPLPLTAWGQQRLKANRPTGTNTSAIDSDDPDFQCFPSGVPRVYLFLYPMEMIHITLEDPKDYTTPLHTQKKYVLKPDWNLMEFVCEDNSLNYLDYEKKTR